MSDNGPKVAPPYISFRTFQNLLDRLSTHMPQRIDRHYWGSFLGGSVGANLMTGLRFLELITEDNTPTDTLESLVDPTKRKVELATLLQRRYAMATQIADPAKCAIGNIQDAFRRAYKIEGDTVRKSVAFFLHAWQFAELPLSPLISDKTRTGGTSTRRTTSNRRPPRSTPSTPTTPITPAAPIAEPETGQQPGRPTPEGPYDAMMQTLIRRLPLDGRWTADKRKRWLAAVAANIDLWIDLESEEEDGEEFDPFSDEEE